MDIALLEMNAGNTLLSSGVDDNQTELYSENVNTLHQRLVAFRTHYVHP